DAIRPPDTSSAPNPSTVTISLTPSLGSELSRVPAYDPAGHRIGDRVTYELDEHVEIGVSGQPVPAPGTYEFTYTWMWGVRFEGETPVPMYIRVHSSCVVDPLSLSWTTLEPVVRLEYTDGGVTVE